MTHLSAQLDEYEERLISELQDITERATSMPNISRSNIIKGLLIEFGPIKIAQLHKKCQENSKHLEVTYGINDTPGDSAS